MNVSSITSPAASTGLEHLSEPVHPARAKASAFNAAALRNASPAEQRTAVAAQFEAILVRQLLGKTMTSMLGSGSGAATSVYGDLLTDTISQQLTAGQGLGLGRFIEQQLAPKGATTTDHGQPATPSESAPSHASVTPSSVVSSQSSLP
jgi:Rod binding domain-containing protein